MSAAHAPRAEATKKRIHLATYWWGASSRWTGCSPYAWRVQPLSRAAATEVALGASAVEAVEDRKRDGEEKARKRRERAVLKAPRWNRNIVFGFEI